MYKRQIERIAADPEFPLTIEEIRDQIDPRKYIGRCPSQVDEFLRDVAHPIAAKYREHIESELKV